MADATPTVPLPEGAQSGLPRRPAPIAIRGRQFAWGQRTFLMGIINVTPDSFSGDGLLAVGEAPSGDRDDRRAPSVGVASGRQGVPQAVEQALRMAEEGADLLDIGGESTRPGHAHLGEDEELARVIPVLRAIREALPKLPLSVDTQKPAVAVAALAAGADILNDVGAVGPGGEAMARVAAEHDVPIVVVHDRAEARYVNVKAEVIADLQRALERALRAGVRWEHLIVDPGMGFGKTVDQNLALFHDLAALRILGRPVLLGMSRKSTIGRVLDLPAEQRLEGTLATSALAIAAGVDILRVHDVEANHRAARVADAIVRQAGDRDVEEGP